jgi:CheY-specific phosphatase CheX
MIEDAVRRLLAESAGQTLETMFFAAPDSVSAAAERPPGALIASSLTFQGSPSGSFAAVVSTPLAVVLATDFLGMDDTSGLGPGQVEMVVGELSNIICGAVLSELEAGSNFDISSPRLVSVSASEPGPDFQTASPVSCRLEMPQGAIVLHLAFEETA